MDRDSRSAVRRALREGVVDPIKHRFDEWRMQRAVSQLRRLAEPDAKVLAAAHHAWGNESYSADLRYLSQVASCVAACRGPILECGSGLTTIIAGVLGERLQATVLSLEQDAGWAQRVRRSVKSNNITNTRVVYAPLREFDGYVWYDIEKIDMPSRFDLVICDGPAVFESWGELHAGWRYGLLPVLRSRKIEVGDILLDDANEPRAAAMLAGWRDKLGFGYEVHPSADFAMVSRRS